MTERDAPSADAVKLVDEALCARAVFAQDAFSARDTRISHSRLVTARAALLDYISGLRAELADWQGMSGAHANEIQRLKTEIERLKAEHESELKHYENWCGEREQEGFSRGEEVGRSDVQAELAAKGAEIERLREARDHWMSEFYSRSADADVELARFKAAQPVPVPARQDSPEDAVLAAFEIGFCWANAVRSEAVQDSRDVCRTLSSDLFCGLRVADIPCFETKEHGIVAAKQAIRAALLAKYPMRQDSKAADRLMTAVEGECNGFAITREQAERILDYMEQPMLCDDEGCPHYGTPHVCVTLPDQAPARQDSDALREAGSIEFSGDRYKAAGPWPDGQFYVWDKSRSSITHPSGSIWEPWPRLNSLEEAQTAAASLNAALNPTGDA